MRLPQGGYKRDLPFSTAPLLCLLLWAPPLQKPAPALLHGKWVLGRWWLQAAGSAPRMSLSLEPAGVPAEDNVPCWV